MSYAQSTHVPVERSRAEIEKILKRHGASQFLSGWNDRHATVSFVANNKIVRFKLPFPDPEAKSITHRKTRSGFSPRKEQAKKQIFEQEIRRRWRALSLVIKAKLEAIESEVSTFETEFMPHFVMPDDKTIAEHVLPRLEAIYRDGKARTLLPDFRSERD